MAAFWKVYEWLEIKPWNSLTKKLMSFLPLFLLDASYILIYLRVGDSLRGDLSGKVSAQVRGAHRIARRPKHLPGPVPDLHPRHG